jgi:cyclopropane-fatty-acyl-phospholipid synthase
MALHEAQEAKLDHICRKLDLEPEDQFLDIGCGWGGLILHAAERYGVHAVGITLSDDQRAYVSQQIEARGLTGQVKVRRMDYRDVPENGGYDKIASVGMFEHVGRLNLRTYFDKINALLKPGGLVLNHGITTAEPEASGLGSGIRIHRGLCVPGGELVHASDVLAPRRQRPRMPGRRKPAPPLWKTLWHWVTRLQHLPGAPSDRRAEIRIWRITAGSAHAFDRGWMELWQVLAARASTATSRTIRSSGISFIARESRVCRFSGVADAQPMFQRHSMGSLGVF